MAIALGHRGENCLFIWSEGGEVVEINLKWLRRRERPWIWETKRWRSEEERRASLCEERENVLVQASEVVHVRERRRTVLSIVYRESILLRDRGENGDEQEKKSAKGAERRWKSFFFRFFLLMIILELVFWVWTFYLFIEWLGKISDDGKNWVALGNK